MSGRSFITDTQRDYLTGEHEPPSSNAEQQMRRRIRENTRQAFLDLATVSDRIEHRDLNQIGWTKRSADDPLNKDEMLPFFSGSEVPAITSLMYRLRASKGSFEHALESGIEDALEREGRLAGVNVDIRVVHERSTADIKERLEQGGVEAVTASGLRYLFEQGELTADEFSTYWEKYQEDRPEPSFSDSAGSDNLHVEGGVPDTESDKDS